MKLDCAHLRAGSEYRAGSYPMRMRRSARQWVRSVSHSRCVNGVQGMLSASHAWRSVRHGGELSNWSAKDEGTKCESCAVAAAAMRANNKAVLIRAVADIGISPD